jgi:hypothetical protein
MNLIFVQGLFPGDCHSRMEFSEIMLIREEDNPKKVINIYTYIFIYLFIYGCIAIKTKNIQRT